MNCRPPISRPTVARRRLGLALALAGLSLTLLLGALAHPGSPAAAAQPPYAPVRTPGTVPILWTRAVSGMVIYDCHALGYGSGVLFAGTLVGDFRSADAGAHWDRVRFLDPPGLTAARQFAVAPSDPRTVYLTDDWSGIRRSTDGGDTWHGANGDIPATNGFAAIAVSPISTSQLLAGFIGDVWWGAYRSPDAGAHWTCIDDLPATNVEAFVFAPALPTRVYAATGAGVYRSEDAGATWASTALTTPAYSLAFSPLSPTLGFAGTADGVYRTQDGGATWTRVVTLGVDVHPQVAVAPQDPATAYATGYRNLLATHDGGTTWRPVLVADAIVGLAVTPDHVFVCGDTYGVLRGTPLPHALYLPYQRAGGTHTPEPQLQRDVPTRRSTCSAN